MVPSIFFVRFVIYFFAAAAATRSADRAVTNDRMTKIKEQQFVDEAAAATTLS